jgi:hypothetical protein
MLRFKSILFLVSLRALKALTAFILYTFILRRHLLDLVAYTL